MDARFGLQEAIDEIAFDFHGSGLQPGFFARLIVDEFGGKALAFYPAIVHTEEHIGPVLRLGASGSGMDGQDGISMIIGPGEQGFELELFEPADDAVGVVA